MLPHLTNSKWDHQTQREQLDLLGQLNAERINAQGEDSVLNARIASMETAFRMQYEASEPGIPVPRVSEL